VALARSRGHHAKQRAVATTTVATNKAPRRLYLDLVAGTEDALASALCRATQGARGSGHLSPARWWNDTGLFWAIPQVVRDGARAGMTCEWGGSRGLQARRERAAREDVLLPRAVHGRPDA
jgi:hypothetical protein